MTISAKNRTVLLGFPENRSHCQTLAEKIGIEAAIVDIHRFPDGESCVKLPPLNADHAIVLRSMHDANEKLIELLFTASSARQMGVQHLTLLAPYLCYMRQDHAFEPGQAVSQKVIGEFLSQHYDCLLTIDPHLHRTPKLEQAMPFKQSHTLTASRALSDYLAKVLDDAPLILGPDAESEQWAVQIAAPRNWEYAIATKTRFGDHDVQVEVPNVSVKDRIVVIIDDISSTGNTLMQAAQQLENQGARHIYAIVTHALLSEEAMQRMREAGIEKIWSSDSIEHSTNVVATLPVLRDAIERLLLK